MANTIQPSEITGGSVYGVTQVEYTVDGSPGKNFVDAVTTASFKVAVAIEEAGASYSAVIEARQKKLNDLGQVLALFTEAVAKLPTKKAGSDDKAPVNSVAWISDTLAYYGISVPGLGSQMVRGDLQKAQTEVQYQIDKEDNTLQQDIVSMQSYITKRDNAYSTAAKIIKKANNAAKSTIRNIGG